MSSSEHPSPNNIPKRSLTESHGEGGVHKNDNQRSPSPSKISTFKKHMNDCLHVHITAQENSRINPPNPRTCVMKIVMVKDSPNANFIFVESHGIPHFFSRSGSSHQ